MKKIALYTLLLSFFISSAEEATLPKTFIIKDENGTLIMGTQSKDKSENEENTKEKLLYAPNIFFPIKQKPVRPPEPRPTMQDPSQK